jgi:hypothetical protein
VRVVPGQRHGLASKGKTPRSTRTPLPRSGFVQPALSPRPESLTRNVAHEIELFPRHCEEPLRRSNPCLCTALERDDFCFESVCRLAQSTSPACGERSKFAQRISGEGDSPRSRCLWKQPLTPTLSPRRAGRGSAPPVLRQTRGPDAAGLFLSLRDLVVQMAGIMIAAELAQ